MILLHIQLHYTSPTYKYKYYYHYYYYWTASANPDHLIEKQYLSSQYTSTRATSSTATSTYHQQVSFVAMRVLFSDKGVLPSPFCTVWGRSMEGKDEVQ